MLREPATFPRPQSAEAGFESSQPDPSVSTLPASTSCDYIIGVVFLDDFFLLAALVCFHVSLFHSFNGTYDSIFYLTTFLFRLFRLLSVVLFFAVINNVEDP